MRCERVAGYYTLANGSVSRDEAPAGIAQGLGRNPVPIPLLARLAVDSSEKEKGPGRGLLKDAIMRAHQASELAGSQAIVTQARDEDASAFYPRFKFSPSPLNEFQLYPMMKDVRALVGLG